MLLQFSLNIVYAHILLWQAIEKSSGIKRNQLKYIFLGTLSGFIGGSTNYFLWYKIPIPPYLNSLVSFYVLSVAYSIFKYRLMDIRLALSRASVFVSVYTFVLGIPFALGVWFRPCSLVDSRRKLVAFADGGDGGPGHLPGRLCIFTWIRRWKIDCLKSKDVIRIPSSRPH